MMRIKQHTIEASYLNIRNVLMQNHLYVLLNDLQVLNQALLEKDLEIKRLKEVIVQHEINDK
jgi:hypothetical protein